ncbi:hypothetical protein BC828DRAFT_330877, partial [Blastocladiella britannica]
PFVCRTCTRGFLDRAAFEQHQMLHSSNRAFKCPVCQRGFARKADCLRHLRSAHVDPRPFRCSACPKAYSRKDALRKH